MMPEMVAKAWNIRQRWVAESNASTTANSTMHKSLKR